MAIPWGKIIHAAIVGGIEFVNALGEDIDLDGIAKAAHDYVEENKRKRKAAEDAEDDAFSSAGTGGES